MDSSSSIGLFPVVRRFSAQLTPLLARTPVSANQITAASLAFGLASAWGMAMGTHAGAIYGACALIVCYVLDNSDGEIARLKGQSSEFGRRFDNFVDWSVHTAFFAALGYGAAQSLEWDTAIWLGWAAAVGSTLNYVIGTIAEEKEAAEARRGQAELLVHSEPGAVVPDTWRALVMLAFRELSRADFCFIVLALAIFDATWILLPLGAIGAQVFWFVHLLPGARRTHV